MEYLKNILNEAQTERFKELLARSAWLSNIEKDQFLGKTLPHPPVYLARAAFDAVQEEAAFYERLKENRPDVYDYLKEMRRWLDREDKTFINFPGFGDQFGYDVLDFIYPNELTESDWEYVNPLISDDRDEIPEDKRILFPPHILDLDEDEFLKLLAGSTELTVTVKVENIYKLKNYLQNELEELINFLKDEKQLFIKSREKKELESLKEKLERNWKEVQSEWQEIRRRYKLDEYKPIGSFGLETLPPLSQNIKIPPHKLQFDGNKFLLLLAGSISLNKDEKIRVIKSIPKLSQQQIEELIRILEEEKRKFSKLDIKQKETLRSLEMKNTAEWEDVCLHFKTDLDEELKEDSDEHEDTTSTETDITPEIEEQSLPLQSAETANLPNEELSGSKPAESNDPNKIERVEPVRPIGSFGIKALSPASKFIKRPPHNLQFDEDYFYTMLAGTISLTLDEKRRVIEAIPRLSQIQIDELIRILEEEKGKFSQLDIKHEYQLRAIEKQHALEWEVLCLIYRLESEREQKDLTGIFNNILKIENLFHRYRFSHALQTIKQNLLTNPNLIYLYEYYFQAVKISDTLTPEIVHSVLQEHFKEIPSDLYDVLTLLYDFEEIHTKDERIFLKKLEEFAPSEKYAFIKPYLRGKYQLYYGQAEDSLNQAEAFITEAISSTVEADIEAVLYLYHFQIKVLMARKNFKGISGILKTFFQNETLPPYYRYIQLIGICLDTTNKEVFEKNCRYALENFIRLYARQHGMKDLEEAFPEPAKAEPSEDGQNPAALWKAMQELDQIIRELGFVNEDEQSLETGIDRLIGKGEYAQAIALIEPKLQTPEWSDHEYNLMATLFGLLRKQGELSDEYARYKVMYQQNPSFHNTFVYFMLLHAMEYQYRHEAKETATVFAKKYYFLPAGHLTFFENEHERFIKPQFTLQAEKSISLALSCGISDETFEAYSEYFRWKQDDFPANILDLLNGMIFNGIFNRNIIGVYKKDWEKFTPAFALISINKNPYNKAIYNCMALSQSKKQGLSSLVGGLLLVKALNIYYSWDDSTLFTNKTSDFNSIARGNTSLQHAILYMAVRSVLVDTHKTWSNYVYLLSASEILGRNELYLPALYTAMDYECPEIRDAHKETARKIIGDYLNARPSLTDFSFAVFLAVGLNYDKSYWIDERNIPDIEAAAFDVLQDAEAMLDAIDLSECFLGAHAHEVFLSLTARDWYLYYRYPEKTCSEKYEKKLETLRTLQASYPLFPLHENIDQVSWERTVKSFIACLDSGRVASDPSSTLEKVRADAAEKVERFGLRRTVYLENIGTIRDVLDEYRQDMASPIITALEPLYGAWEQTERIRFKSDITVVFKTIEDETRYEKELRKTLLKYGFQDVHIFQALAPFHRSAPQYLDLFRENNDRIRALKDKIKQDQIQTGLELFDLIRNVHVLRGSDMFESFRKRIRHGWLISSLKDCFARHDLYMDGEEKDISPTLESVLSRVSDEEAKKEVSAGLADLKQAFNAIAEWLDKEILTIKDEDHPHGLLDYADEHFNPKKTVAAFFEHKELSKDHLNDFILFWCKRLDDHTRQCFENIKTYLDEAVYRPLHQKIRAMEQTVEKHNPAFAFEDRDQLIGKLEDAATEFQRNIEKYKTWFDFYRSAVRDFTLPEVIGAAERIVWDINLAEIRKKNIAHADRHFGPGVGSLYLLGANFHDMLEIFKILFQNAVYHAVVHDADQEIGMNIDVNLQDDSEGKRLGITFSTRHDEASADTACLMEMVCDEEKRRRALSGRQGTGLAAIADILHNRLKGVRGAVEDIRWNESERRFQVRFHLQVAQEGKMAEPTREEELQTLPVEELAEGAIRAKGLKILIVEDQPAKYQSMRDFLETFLAGTHVTHAWDVETTCRLLLLPDVKFDLILLDMTLPVESSFDAELKSLAGLIVLKVMSLNDIHTPTVLVTQYANWAAEAARTDRVFIESMDEYCQKAYKGFYKGAIRFSHTETEWRKRLKEIVYSLQEMAAAYSEKGDYAKAIEFYEKEIQRSPDAAELLFKLADARRRKGDFTAAMTAYRKVLDMRPDAPDALAGMALTCAEAGDSDGAERYFKKFKALQTEDADPLRERILDAKLRTINHHRQQLYRSEMMATLGQMVAGMAHEMNTPLQRILTNAQITVRSDRKGGLTHEEVQENMDGIVDAVKRMSQQIDHIRALAKEDHLKTEPVDVNAVIRNAHEFFHQQLQNHHIGIRLDFHPNLPEITANRARVEQIFINLIQNALDALIPVKGRKKEIIVRTQYRRGDTPEIHIYFEDNGIGISADQKDKLFEPFFTTKPPGKGMGLGLSIVQRAVSELGGEIRLYSESSVGLTFLITIPVKNTEA